MADNELVNIHGNRLLQHRSTEAFDLPGDPEFSLINANPESASLINTLLDAWQKFDESVIN
ncbi:hypothetical protein GCM10027180_27220 [Microbulbifer echini]